MNRRNFIKTSAIITGSALLPISGEITAQTSEVSELIVLVKKGGPEALVKKALEQLGGIKRFVSKGDKVLVKPNIGWDRNPAQAANTHPQVVSEVVRQCLEAGASKVMVLGNTCNSAERCYDNSGIKKAAQEAGAEVSYMIKQFYRQVNIDGVELKRWEFYKPALEADKFINLPILKHHALAGVTAGIKNIMGIIGGNRGTIHTGFDAKIVDLYSVRPADLTIVDATRILTRNGPTGGSLGDVRKADTVIAGIDPVAVDAAAVKLFGLPPSKLGFLIEAEKRGLGSVSAGMENLIEIDLAA